MNCTVYCLDLKYLTDAELLGEIKRQNPSVLEIK